MLARAIAQRPRFVFVDDPTLGTDSSTTAVFSEILRDLALDPAVTLLIASNDATVTREIPLRRYKMQYGRLQEVRLT